MKTKWILGLMLLAVLPLSSSALVINTSSSNSTSDNDSTTNGDAGRGRSTIGSTGATVDTVGNNAELGYRFTGYNAGRGVDNSGQQAEGIVQDVDVTVTWSIVAESWEEYSFKLNPEFHAFLNILDEGLFQESGDIVSVSGFSAVLKRNGGTVGNTLDLSGGSTGDRNATPLNVDDTASQLFSGLSGNNTFELRYTATITATWKLAGAQDNRTANAVLWGQNGTMGGDSFANNFDEYSISSEDPSEDGLFVPATVTLNAVPEPASVLMLLFGGGVIALKRRFFAQV
jgi:hypothetical protein